MPTLVHEAIVEFFRVRPMLAGELLLAGGWEEMPSFERGEVLNAQLPQLTPVEYRADLLLRLLGPSPLAVVVEVQLQPDPRKEATWPVYACVARADLGCEVVVLVVTLDTRTEAWAGRPIRIGPGSVVQPIVLGPAHIPLITDPEAALRSPELAVLSAMTHGKSNNGLNVGRAAIRAAQTLDEDRRRLYCDLVLHAVDRAAKQLLEKLMLQNWEPQSDFFKRMYEEAKREVLAEVRAAGLQEGRQEGIEQGHTDGQRELLLRQLQRRFGPLPEALRQRVGSADEAQLGQWGEDLLFASSLEALFGGEAQHT